MNEPDIRRSISLKIDKDVKDLTNICSVDKLAQKICSKADFYQYLKITIYFFRIQKLIMFKHGLVLLKKKENYNYIQID
jgi:hypothetical protein